MRDGVTDWIRSLAQVRRHLGIGVLLGVGLSVHAACEFSPFESLKCGADADCVDGAICVEQTCRFDDSPDRVVEVVVEPSTVDIDVGERFTLMARALDAAGEPVAAPVNWAVDDGNVAQVSPEGVVIASGPGTAMVSALVEVDGGAKRGTATVNVGCGNVTSLSIVPVEALVVAAPKKLEVLAFDSCGSVDVATLPVLWSVSDSNVATIDSREGEVFPLAEGRVEITASVGTQSATLGVDIVSLPVDRIQIIGPSVLYLGEPAALGLEFYASQNAIDLVSPSVEWGVDDASVVGLSRVPQVPPDDSQILVAPNKLGTTDIRATCVRGTEEYRAVHRVRVEPEVCKAQDCSGRGTCDESEMGQPVCSCDLGFSGGNCEDCDAASGHYDDGAGGCLNPVDLRADSRLVLWLDATSTPMISIQPESTDRVAVWRDRSGLNHDASSVEEARPIYRSGAGFSHIAFSDQTHLEISSQFTAGTVFVVARYDRHPDFFQENAGLFSGSGSGRKRIYFTGEKDTNRWLHLDGGGMQRSRLDEKFVNGQNPADLGAMNTHEITVSLQDFAIYSGTDSAPIQDSNWFLGVDRDVDGDGWRGSVAELLVYDVALEPVDRLRVERYLNVKYEIY